MSINKGKLFLGEPLLYKEKYKIYPPKLKEVVNGQYNLYSSLLTITREEIEDIIRENIKADIEPYNIEINRKEVPTPFYFLLANCRDSERYERLVQEAFQFFLGVEVTFLYDYPAILLLSLEDLKEELNKADFNIDNFDLITDENFHELQEILRVLNNEEKIVDDYDENLHPKAVIMKAKSRYRDSIKRKNNGGTNIEELMSTLCCMGIGLNPLNVGDISYFAAISILDRYSIKEAYNRGLTIATTGLGERLKSFKSPDWIGHIDYDKK